MATDPNEIIYQIALEELNLSQTLNTAGESIQMVVGTLPGGTPATSIQDLLNVDTQAQNTIQSVSNEELLLVNLLQCTIAGGTGCTGITGQTGCPNSAQLTDSSSSVLAVGDSIPFDTNIYVNGTTITHTPPSPNIVLAQGTYAVQYSVTSSTVSPDFPTVDAYLNTMLVTGSSSQGTTSGVPQTFGMNFFVTVPAGGGILSLCNASASTMTLVSLPPDATFTIVQLS